MVAGLIIKTDILLFLTHPGAMPPPGRQVVSLVSSQVCVCNNSNSYANIIYSPIGGGLAVFLSLKLIYCQESAKNEKVQYKPFGFHQHYCSQVGTRMCMCKSAWKCQFEISSSNCAHNLPWCFGLEFIFFLCSKSPINESIWWLLDEWPDKLIAYVKTLLICLLVIQSKFEGHRIFFATFQLLSSLYTVFP